MQLRKNDSVPNYQLWIIAAQMMIKQESDFYFCLIS